MVRSKPRRSARRPTEREAPRPPRWDHLLPWALFALAFALRLAFWQATPDRDWPHSVFYKGDAATWLAYAEALRADQPFELGLPLRPPGNAYLLAALGDVGPSALKLFWCLLGAFAVVALHGAARRGFGPGIAAVVGLACAVSSGLIVLSTSLNNETPYLALVASTLWLGPGDPRRGRLRPLAWGVLHGLACLVRVEHLLVFALALGFEAVRQLRGLGRNTVLGWGLALGVGFVAVLLPWHLHAWGECRRFNRVEPETNPATERAFQQVEQAVAGIAWSEEAQNELERIPAASRRTLRNFVAATTLVRGGGEVAAGDVDRLLREAFGAPPRFLNETPLVALYGGLNFYLAHHPEAGPGFARGPLDDPPPLDGGVGRYPAPLVAGLPPPDLALTYPPHLQIVNEGYRLGLEAIRADPGRAVGRGWAQLRLLWDGATLGFGGYNLPWGFKGPRRRVDLAVPDRHLGVVLWQLAWLTLAGIGLWGLRRRPEWLVPLVPWLALLVGKLVATVAFFGYARHGATVIPVVVLLAALGVATLRPGVFEGRQRVKVGAIVVALVVVVELFRWISPPTPRIDGRSIGPADPWPLELHEDRRLDFGPVDTR